MGQARGLSKFHAPCQVLPRPGFDRLDEERHRPGPRRLSYGEGDMRVVADFLRVLRGEPPSLSSTPLEDSIAGHCMVFAADHAMETGTVVALDRMAPWAYAPGTAVQ